MTRLLIRARHVIFAATVLTLVALLLFGERVRYEQSLQSFFSEDDPIVHDYERASALFGNDNLVFIVYDDPELLTFGGMDRVAELAASLRPERIGAVVDVQSLDAMPLFWRLDDELIRVAGLPRFLRAGARAVLKTLAANLDPSAVDALTVGAAVREAAPGDLPALKERITSHPLLEGTVVNAEGKSTAVVVRLRGMGEQEPRDTIAALRAAADEFAERHGLGRPALVGPPVLLADGFAAIEQDGRRLAIVGMTLIGLVTLTATQSLWWAIVPILAGWTTWLATEHVLGSLDLRLSLSGGPLVAQIIVLTMPAASHLAIRFRDDLRRRFDRPAAAVETVRIVARPILWTALTGAIGYGALLSSNVVPVRQFGAVLAVSTLAATLLTLFIAPIAMLPPFRLEVPVRPGSISRVDRALDALTHRVYRHPLPIVLGVIVVVLPLASGIPRLSFESNYIHAFKPQSRVVQDYYKVEERLGGIGLVALVVPTGEALDMATLERFREMDRRVEKAGAGAEAITRVLSPATVLDPEGRLAALPAEQAEEALALKLELIAASPQRDLLRGFWNPEAGWSRAMVRLSERQSAPAKETAFAQAEATARAAFGPEAFLTGMSYLLTQTTRGIISTQWTAFAWSLGGIALMLTLAFRRVSLAALAILPSLLAVALVLGLMGWREIKLDLATALIASVALGLSVDDTFHCLLQFRRHRLQGETFRESLFASYSVTSVGVLLSSLAVGVGFAVLRFSEFVPFSNFGTMVGIATLGSSLGNLVLLPACLSLGEQIRTRWRAGASASEPARPAEAPPST